MRRQRKEGTHVAERSSHHDRLVAVDLVVVVDLLNAHDSGVGGTIVLALRLLGLVPVEDTADEGGDEGDTSLGAGDGLGEAEEEGEVAVDLVVALELAGGLDSLPSRSDLDKDAVLGDSEVGVKCDELLGLDKMRAMSGGYGGRTEGRAHLGLGGLLVEGKGSVDLGRDASRNDGEDLLAELDELRSLGGEAGKISCDLRALLLAGHSPGGRWCSRAGSRCLCASGSRNQVNLWPSLSCPPSL